MYTAPAGRPDPRRREPLWTRVDRNRIKLAAYVVLFVASAVVTAAIMLVVFGGGAFVYLTMRATNGLSLVWLASELGGIILWVSAFVGGAALGWALFAINRSEAWLVKRLGADFVDKGELIEVKMALKDMAIAGGLPVAPVLYLLEDSSVNAFVFSARGRRPIVGVTRGMVEKLTLDEQRAMFANLVARIVSGDTIVNTGVAALMLPLHAYRTRHLERQNAAMDYSAWAESPVRTGGSGSSAVGTEGVFFLFLFGIAMAIVGAVFLSLQRHRQLRAAEKADAEGMLLLKDPRPMLSALERCVLLDNSVEVAGEAFADLFYCWPGFSSNDEDDPEWRRVARLREVLGVEGMVDTGAFAVPDGALAPQAPRLD